MFSFVIMDFESGEILMLFASHASVVRTPSPPAFVMIAALFLIFGYFSRILATENNCFIESQV